MPRSFDMSADYDASVERLHGAFADEQYWRDRLADSGADEATLDALDVHTDGSLRARTTQVLYTDRLPGIVTQFHRGDLHIVRTETWTPVAGGRASATVAGDIPGAPVTLTGEATLAARQPTGCGLTLHGRIEVRVPLVGGKIEEFIRSQLSVLLMAEQRFTTGWCSANP